MPDELIERVAETLREPVMLPARVDAAVMSQVRASASEPRRVAERNGVIEWLLSPRLVPLSPLTGLAIAAGVVAVLVIGARPRSARIEERASAPASPASSVVPVSNAIDTVARFVLVAPGAHAVSVVGDFNDWTIGATPLTSAGAGVWTAAVPVTPGRHEYRFVIDSARWVSDPSAPSASVSDFGAPNSVVTVGGGR